MITWQTTVARLLALAGSTTAENERLNALSSAVKILARQDLDLPTLLQRAALPPAPVPCGRCRLVEQQRDAEARLSASRIASLEREVAALRAGNRTRSAEAGIASPPDEEPMTAWACLKSKYDNSACRLCGEEQPVGTKIFWQRGQGIRCVACHAARKKKT